jgi:hypothetical protein
VVDEPDQDDTTPTASRSLTITGPGGQFGSVDMLGSLDPAIPGLQSSVDERGATYIKPGALTITIQSDNAWTLNCAITGNQTLHWRLGGTDTWLAFGSPDQPVACASGPAGTTVVTIDLSLQVAAGVDRGQFASTISFALGE